MQNACNPKPIYYRLRNFGYLVTVWFTLSYTFRPTCGHLQVAEVVQFNSHSCTIWKAWRWRHVSRHK